MYVKEFEIRWSDIDANRYLANGAYINFMSHTRMKATKIEVQLWKPIIK